MTTPGCQGCTPPLDFEVAEPTEVERAFMAGASLGALVGPAFMSAAATLCERHRTMLARTIARGRR